MDIELLTQSERASLLEGLRSKRLAERAEIGVLYGESFAAALRLVGKGNDADKVLEMVERVRRLTFEVRP